MSTAKNPAVSQVKTNGIRKVPPKGKNGHILNGTNGSRALSAHDIQKVHGMSGLDKYGSSMDKVYGSSINRTGDSHNTSRTGNGYHGENIRNNQSRERDHHFSANPPGMSARSVHPPQSRISISRSGSDKSTIQEHIRPHDEEIREHEAKKQAIKESHVSPGIYAIIDSRFSNYVLPVLPTYD